MYFESISKASCEPQLAPMFGCRLTTVGIAMKWSGLKQMSLGLVTCVACKSHACGVNAGFSNILSAGGSMAGVCRAASFP